MDRSEPGSAPTQKRSWMRFHLRSVMGFVLLLAVALGAFRLGRDVGFEEGSRDGFAAGINAKVFPKTYRVADLLLGAEPQTGNPDFDTLLNEIVSEVQPTSWEGAGGPATLAPYPQNVSLVVSQTSRGHDELVEFLEGKRLELHGN